MADLPPPGLYFPFFTVNTSRPQSEKLQFPIGSVTFLKEVLGLGITAEGRQEDATKAVRASPLRTDG